MTVVIIVRRHRPRKRAIPYAAAYRMIIGVSGILGRPVKPGDDSCDYCSPSSPAKADDPVRRGLSNDHQRLWNTGSPGQLARTVVTIVRRQRQRVRRNPYTAADGLVIRVSGVLDG